MKLDGLLTKNILPNGPEIIQAEGLYLKTKNQKSILDFSSQTLNLNLGQRHKIIIQTLEKYIKDSPTFLSSRFINGNLIRLSKLLVKLAPQPINLVNLKLTNGSDANESAFKRVRIYRQKPYIISFKFSHLGETSETIQASGSLLNKKFIGGSKDYLFIDPPFLTCSHKLITACSLSCLSHVEAILKKRKDVAAIVLEPVMVNAGAFAFDSSYLKILRTICNKYDISLIFDEIQTAFGWMGEVFASTLLQVTPDIITLGKSISAGFPLSCVLMKKEYDVVPYGFDEFTYGAHPLSIMTALNSIKYLLRSNIMKKVKKTSAYFYQKLEELSRKHSLIKQIRAYGLIVGIEFSDNSTALRVFDKCLEEGLMLRKCKDGLGESLVAKPSLIVTKSDINKAIDILDKALSDF